MTADTSTQTEAGQNGTGPAPGTAASPDAPCEDCATGGERVMAVLAGLFAAFIFAMAIDMFTGGRVSGYVRERTAAGE